jgi:hypothetical protein
MAMRSIAIILAALSFGALLSRAHAAPPTVTPSPGYDARLQEERAGRSAQLQYRGLPQRQHRPRIRHHHHRQ